ncbi:hypothetical protein PG990_005134 [Apiospora arundinis]
MLLQILHLAQAALAGYGGQQSFAAIQNLQKYEETAQKAAKWSNEADRQLKKTRTTQAAGVVALVMSLVASVLLAFRGRSMGFLVRTLASPFMTGCLFLARQYMQDYWGGSKRGAAAQDGQLQRRAEADGGPAAGAGAADVLVVRDERLVIHGNRFTQYMATLHIAGLP